MAYEEQYDDSEEEEEDEEDVAEGEEEEDDDDEEEEEEDEKPAKRGRSTKKWKVSLSLVDCQVSYATRLLNILVCRHRTRTNPNGL